MFVLFSLTVAVVWDTLIRHLTNGTLMDKTFWFTLKYDTRNYLYHFWLLCNCSSDIFFSIPIRESREVILIYREEKQKSRYAHGERKVGMELQAGNREAKGGHLEYGGLSVNIEKCLVRWRPPWKKWSSFRREKGRNFNALHKTPDCPRNLM